jgi:hypothetical protein
VINITNGNAQIAAGLRAYAAQSMSAKAKALGRGFNPAEGFLHSRVLGVS